MDFPRLERAAGTFWLSGHVGAASGRLEKDISLQSVSPVNRGLGSALEVDTRPENCAALAMHTDRVLARPYILVIAWTFRILSQSKTEWWEPPTTVTAVSHAWPSASVHTHIFSRGARQQREQSLTK